MLFKLLLVIGFFEPWGEDTALLRRPRERQQIEMTLATQITDAVIAFHQDVISPVDGPRSHYRPSSSQYMQEAIHNYGFFKGFIMGCDRLLRENDEPWVYRTIQYHGRTLKYDPATENKYE
jgi:uncharacterized protein